MPRIISILMVIAVMLQSMTACGPSARDPSVEDTCSPHAPAGALTAEEAALYDTTVGVLLTQDLWTERDTYDAAHYLMVPMHYAFQSGNAQYIHAFGAFFDRFAEDITGEDSYGFLEYGLLTILQFYYFVTQFISLCAQYGYEDLVPVKLIPVITEKVSQFYYEVPGNWNCEPTRQEHFKQVLAGKDYNILVIETQNTAMRWTLCPESSVSTSISLSAAVNAITAISFQDPRILGKGQPMYRHF